MAMTFRTKFGALMTTKVGLDDVVTLFSAGKAVYGWIGGLDNIRFLLENISNPLSTNIQKLKLDTNLQLKPVHALVITKMVRCPCTLKMLKTPSGETRPPKSSG